MNASQRRERFRRLLAGETCVSPASVHDPLSARLAESVGFELGLFSGSIASAVILAAPDLILHTLTEFADHIRRILRASTLSLIVDADNGFGNALEVMRTVEELEHAGVSALSVEDTVGPAFSSGVPVELVSLEEAVGKYRAAVAARSDPALAIAARTRVLTAEGIDRAIVRVKAYAAAGVDLIWTPQINSLEEVRAIHEAARLPIVVGSKHGSFSREELAECGVRVALQGHMPIAAAIRAMRDVYVHLAGDPSGPSRPALASSAEMDRLLDADGFQKRLETYLRAPRT